MGVIELIIGILGKPGAERRVGIREKDTSEVRKWE